MATLRLVGAAFSVMIVCDDLTREAAKLVVRRTAASFVVEFDGERVF